MAHTRKEMLAMASHKAELFVQLVPVYFHWDKNKDRIVGVRAVKMTQKKPANPEGGSQVVKLVLDVDQDLFEPKTPNIAISLSKQHINAPSVVEQEVMWKP